MYVLYCRFKPTCIGKHLLRKLHADQIWVLTNFQSDKIIDLAVYKWNVINVRIRKLYIIIASAQIPNAPCRDPLYRLLRHFGVYRKQYAIYYWMSYCIVYTCKARCHTFSLARRSSLEAVCSNSIMSLCVYIGLFVFECWPAGIRAPTARSHAYRTTQWTACMRQCMHVYCIVDRVAVFCDATARLYCGRAPSKLAYFKQPWKSLHIKIHIIALQDE